MTELDDLIELDHEACTAALILEPAYNTQETLIYLNQMGAARVLQVKAEQTPDPG